MGRTLQELADNKLAPWQLSRGDGNTAGSERWAENKAVYSNELAALITLLCYRASLNHRSGDSSAVTGIDLGVQLGENIYPY